MPRQELADALQPMVQWRLSISHAEVLEGIEGVYSMIGSSTQ
jgi:hypothetical protein